MHIFSSAYTIQTRDGTIFAPGVRYIVPTGFARDLEAGIVKEQGESADYRLSHFNSYENRYHGQQLFAHDTLCIYRHGAIGDTLMTTAVVAELRRRNPFATINVYARPDNADLWHGLGVNVILGFPVFDEVRAQHHLLFENLLECDSEPDQACGIDNLFAFAGIDPVSVPSERKVPVVVEREDDYYAGPPNAKYVLMQDSSSNRNRDYPHTDKVRELLFALGYQVLVFGRKLKTPRFRNLIPLIKSASLVICPDSSIGHLAAAFPSVPVISLWGPFSPWDRVLHYANHHPMVGTLGCPHSPCRTHEYRFPSQCKDAPAFDGTACAALASIPPEAVVRRAKEILGL